MPRTKKADAARRRCSAVQSFISVWVQENVSQKSQPDPKARAACCHDRQ